MGKKPQKWVQLVTPFYSEGSTIYLVENTPDRIIVLNQGEFDDINKHGITCNVIATTTATRDDNFDNISYYICLDGVDESFPLYVGILYDQVLGQRTVISGEGIVEKLKSYQNGTARIIALPKVGE